MTPKAKLTTLATALSLTTVLVACGGGTSTDGTDTAGIGGSGFVSSGTITGFGSVFVNGVRFDTTNASFDMEGEVLRRDQVANDQEILSIGMVVKVHGSINADGENGAATKIIFDDDLQGPVSGYPRDTTGLTTVTFTVLGIDVQIDNRTHFDGDIAINTIENGNMVELSGFFDGTGTLIASRIERKTELGENVELKGTITELTGNDPSFSFKLQEFPDYTINTSSTTELKDLSSLSDNLPVEVKGEFNPVTNTIDATEIEYEELEYGDSGEFEMEGFITDFNNISDFKINGIPVDASNAQHSPMNMTLEDSLHVEVEGQMDNGVLIATEIKQRGGEVEIQARVTNINRNEETFEVTPVAGQDPITIKVSHETEADDGDMNYLSFLAVLRENDFVEVEGYQNDQGVILASEVELSDSEEVEIQAVIESMEPSTITLLGTDFNTTSSTEIEDDNNAITSLDDLRDKVNAGERILVKIELDHNQTNIITKIEIED